MKKYQKKIEQLVKKLEEGADGTLGGGFALILPSVTNALIIGGEESNNCLGGNCVEGCGANVARGCGGTVNSAPGCGVSLVS